MICLTAQDVYYPQLTDERWEKLDRFIALCPTHVRFTKDKYPKYAHKVFGGFNGIRNDVIREIESVNPPVRNPRKIIFASSPDRGLLPLLKIFRRARQRVHDLELVVAYGFDNIEKIIASNPPTNHWRTIYDEAMREMRQPGVTWMGRIGQRQLIREKLSCGMSVHPTMFMETGFISGIEEMACGAIPILSPTWAAGDYCKHGVWIFGDPDDALTQARYVGEIFRLARQPELQEHIRAEMMPRARNAFNWERYVDLVESWMYGLEGHRNSFFQFNFALKHAKGAGRILNVGCCDDAGEMSKIGAVNVDKFEFDDHLKTRNAADIISDARDLPRPFQSHSFDMVCSTDMLEHFPTDEVPEQLEKFKACLKPGGRILFTVPNDTRNPNPDDTNVRGYGGHHHCPPEVIDRWLRDARLRAVVRQPIEYGFDDICGEGVVAVDDSPKHSVVFLTYDPDGKMKEMVERSLSLIRQHAPGVEIIIADDKGKCAAINNGFAKTKGEYIHVVCNDMMIHDPDWLETMAVPNTLTGWAPRTFVLTGQILPEMSLFCVPRNIYEAIGRVVWDTAYEDGYGFDDESLIARVKLAGFNVEIRPVKGDHLCLQTHKNYFTSEKFGQMYDRNMEVFKREFDHIKPVGGWLNYKRPA
jgi:SAM-dependent methyltransferase